MLFPIYVTEGVDESPGLRGVSPLVENLTFAGTDLATLFADVRAILSTIATPAVDDAQAVIAKHAEAYSGGNWVIVPIGVEVTVEGEKERTRINISFSKRLAARVERARKANGDTFSGWLAQAATERLTRGG